MALDLLFSPIDTRYLKYGSILLCLLLAVYLVRRGGDRLAALGLALTLGADTCLLLLDRWHLLGVALFFLVQGVYLLRLRPVARRAMLPERGALFLLLLLLLARLGQLSVLNGMAALYISFFFFNLLQSFSWRTREGTWLSLGLCLYFLCDLCVGIYNSPALFPRGLFAFARIGIWLFYLPGQVLIALSAQTSCQGAVRHDKT